MGNICGKADSDNFSQPGRVLGSTPTQPQRAPIPAGIKGTGRTLGGGGAPESSAGSNDPDEARRRAAEAAEARAAKASSAKPGKLSSQLAAQKAQTMEGTLREHSETQRRQRDMDEAAQNRAYD